MERLVPEITEDVYDSFQMLREEEDYYLLDAAKTLARKKMQICLAGV